jgi:hypothetical protein
MVPLDEPKQQHDISDQCGFLSRHSYFKIPSFYTTIFRDIPPRIRNIPRHVYCSFSISIMGGKAKLPTPPPADEIASAKCRRFLKYFVTATLPGINAIPQPIPKNTFMYIN